MSRTSSWAVTSMNGICFSLSASTQEQLLGENDINVGGIACRSIPHSKKKEKTQKNRNVIFRRIAKKKSLTAHKFKVFNLYALFLFFRTEKKNLTMYISKNHLIVIFRFFLCQLIIFFMSVDYFFMSVDLNHSY